MRIPVPLVWIKNPGFEGSWLARPLMMAWAEGSWSACAQSAKGKKYGEQEVHHLFN